MLSYKVVLVGGGGGLCLCVWCVCARKYMGGHMCGLVYLPRSQRLTYFHIIIEIVSH